MGGCIWAGYVVEWVERICVFFVGDDMERIMRFFGLNGFAKGKEEEAMVEAGKWSPVGQALKVVKGFLPEDIDISVPESDVGNMRLAGFIGERYANVFPFLVVCRGATLGSECVVESKRGYYESLKRTAEILEGLEGIEVTLEEEEPGRIHFILRDSTLLDYRWITGFTARVLRKNFHGMPLQYLLHPNVRDGKVTGSFDALVVSGKTLFALRIITMAPHEQFFRRLEDLAKALDLPKSKIVLPVVPQPEWRYIIERFRNRGYAACELGKVSEVLQRIRREEVERYRRNA